MINLEYKWLACQAHACADRWDTTVLMIQLTPEFENTWRRSLVAFAAASHAVEVKELQVRAPMTAVDLDFGLKVSPEFADRVLDPLESNDAWHVLSNAQAQELIKLGEELILEYGHSHLKVWPRTGPFHIRACTAIKNTEGEIYGLYDLHPMLLEVFNPSPTLA
jgi:hypothetical protein